MTDFDKPVTDFDEPVTDFCSLLHGAINICICIEMKCCCIYETRKNVKRFYRMRAMDLVFFNIFVKLSSLLSVQYRYMLYVYML